MSGPGPPGAPGVRFAHTQRFRVAYHDVDALQHLNHAAYFVYMETLRCEYYLGLLGSTDPREIDIILAEAACQYLAPVPFGTELTGEVAPLRPLGTSSFTLAYRFRTPEGELTAQGRTVQVCYDYSAGHKRPIPPGRRARLEHDAIDPVVLAHG